MNPVRVAVVGLGNAGRLHARTLAEGKVPDAELAALVCRPERFDEAVTSGDLPVSDNTRRFDTLDELLAVNRESGECDAIIVATPHRLHPEQTIAALGAGLPVLCEKPAGVRAREAREMTEEAIRFERTYALNLNRRTVPLYQEIREIVTGGRLGTLRRIHWTSTHWFRAQAYYDSSPWRGTWEGEGGGLLLNQWPHLLDLWQWICGMPVRLRASCGFGKRHAIEVEDEVMVFAEYASGATAVFVGSTGEAPGDERMEFIGSRGKLVAEGDGSLRMSLLEAGTIDDFIARAPAGFSTPPYTEQRFQRDSNGDLVSGITKDFIGAVAAGDGRPLLAPGAEGIASLELANAILLSAWNDGAWVSFPLAGTASEAEFERLLHARTAQSKPRTLLPTPAFRLEDSFHRF